MPRPKEIKLPIKFYAGYFHDANGHIIAQMRGWEWIQYLPNAEDLQDSIGEWIAEQLNKDKKS